jgi:hypothetical protein
MVRAGAEATERGAGAGVKTSVFAKETGDFDERPSRFDEV